MSLSHEDLNRLAFLSRLQELDVALSGDIEDILTFVDKIRGVEIPDGQEGHRIRYLGSVDFGKLRSDNPTDTPERNRIVRNFLEAEDDFCVLPLVVEKEQAVKKADESEGSK